MLLIFIVCPKSCLNYRISCMRNGSFPLRAWNGAFACFNYFFVASLSARLYFKRGKINKTTMNASFRARSGNEP